MTQGVQAQLEGLVLVYLAGKQAFLGFAELNEAVQLQFRQYHDLVVLVGAKVNKATVVLLYLGNEQGAAFCIAYPLANFVMHTA